jgi:hypothetical protein
MIALTQTNIESYIYTYICARALLMLYNLYEYVIHFRHVLYLTSYRKKITLIINLIVGKATGYGLNGRGSILRRGKRYFLHSVQSGSRAGPHPMGT